MNALKQIAFLLYLIWGAIVEGIPAWFKYGDTWKRFRNK